MIKLISNENIRYKKRIKPKNMNQDLNPNQFVRISDLGLSMDKPKTGLAGSRNTYLNIKDK